MWRSLWVSASLALATATAAHAAPTYLGATSPEEAELLWKRGQADFTAGKFDDAIPSLKRLVDRYPGFPGFLDAHRLLGIALLKTDHAKEALVPLKHFADAARGGSKDTARETRLEGQLWIARADLELERWNEALLLTEEIRKKSSVTLTRAEAQILKAHALLGLSRDLEAAGATDESLTLLTKEKNAPLQAEARSLLLKLLGRRCALLPSSGGMDEAQARDQFNRRATCQLDTLRLLKDVSEVGVESVLHSATALAAQGYVDLTAHCLSPPEPVKLPKKRTEEQSRAYRADLRKLILPICTEALDRALETVQEWKLPTSPQLTNRLAQQRARLSEAKP